MNRTRFGLLDTIESIPLETKKRLKKKYNNNNDDEQGGNDKRYVETTYSELKSLRDEGKLVPCALYRITDYQCTTTQEETRSAGHQFDIIVQALSESVLSEDARAIQHKFEMPEKCYSLDDEDYAYYDGIVVIDGIKYAKYSINKYSYLININNPTFFGIVESTDSKYKYSFFRNYTWDSEINDWRIEDDDSSLNLNFDVDLREFSYFSNSNLAAWKLKYCLDNDEERFAWAQKGNTGFGVIQESPDNTDDTTILFKRYPQGDKNDKFAWAFIRGSEDVSIVDFTGDYDDIDTSDILLTNTENPKSGDTAELSSIGSINVYVYDYKNIGEIAEGKGVIYQMIDEYNNDCPYDFKNIQFLRSKDWHSEHTDWVEEVIGQNPDMDIYYFTFSWINSDYSVEDVSVVGKNNDINVLMYAKNNVINICEKEIDNKYVLVYLNNIILVSSFNTNGEIYSGTINNIFRYGCKTCTFGDGIHDNIFDINFINNIMSNYINGNKSFGFVRGINQIGNINQKIIYMNSGTIYFKDIKDAFNNT